MWAIDRANLILLGIALGVVAIVGLALLFVRVDQLEPISTASPNHTSATSVAPVDPEPDEVTIQLEPEPTPVPTPTAAPSIGTTSSSPAVDGIIQTAEYAHAMEAGGFRIYWSNDDIVLHMGLFSPGTGYVAIGLDPDRRMQGANFILGTVRNGHAEVRDDYGIGPLSHNADVNIGGTDDILAYAGRELNGQTTIEFVIPLDSGDPRDKPLEPGGTYDILVAFHNTNDSFSARHSQRGTGEIRLDGTPP